MNKKEADSVARFFGGVDPGSDEDDTDTDLDLEEQPAEEPSAVEGEIAIDAYQTDNEVVIVSPIAGVDPENIEISATDDTITISGERKSEHERQEHDVFTQEIYWGSFSRTVTLPAPCVVDKAEASFKHGVLTVRIPKSAKAKKRTIKVKTGE